MLKINKRSFALREKPFFMFSGEIHYFRIPPQYWDTILEKAKEAELNTVSTYVPWCWHEQDEGNFDFTGSTNAQKNLIGFIEKAKKKNLNLILRIGPVCNAELKNEGIPEWLIKKHPEILTRGKGCENLPHTTLLSYLNKTFLKYVKLWYDNLLNVIAPYIVGNKSPVIVVQLDNEIGMSHWVNKTADLSKFTTKMWQNFLKKKYVNIRIFNKIYNLPDGSQATRYKNFSQINQPSGNKDIRTLFDWGIFYRKYFSKYFKFLRDLFRKKSDLPILINIPQFFDYDIRGRGFYSPVTTSFYKEFRKFEKNLIFGGAYQLRRIDYENFHDIFITTEVVSMINQKFPNICAELQTGIMRERPILYPTDVELHLKTSIASGLKGMNCYMFAGGTNPDDLGMFGKWHDWQAPVGYDLKIKPHFEVIKDCGTFLKTWGKYISLTKKLNFTTFGLYLPHWMGEFVNWEQMEYARSRYFFDGIGRLLILNGYQFDIIDLMRENLSEKASLVIFSYKWMDEQTQNKILNYVRKGGRVLIGPEIPEKITEALNIRKSKTEESIIKIKEQECHIEGGITYFEGKFDEVLTQNLTGKATSFLKKLGKGLIVCHGFPVVHYFNYHMALVKLWMKKIGIVLPFKVKPSSVIVTLHKGKNYRFISVFNYHNWRCSAIIKTQRLNLKVDLFPFQSKILPLNIRINKRLKVNYSTSISPFSLSRPRTKNFNPFIAIISEVEVNKTRKKKQFRLRKEKMWINLEE